MSQPTALSQYLDKLALDRRVVSRDSTRAVFGGVSDEVCRHGSKGDPCRDQRRRRCRARVPLVFRGVSPEGGVLGMAFEIGGGSPVLGP
jgi:hypothetical protein